MNRLSRALGVLFGNTPMASPALGLYNLESGAFYDLNDPDLIRFLQDGRETSTGVAVNERMAMRNSAVNRAVRLVSSSMGMLPLQLFERTTEEYQTDEGETLTREVARKASEHSVYQRLHDRPNSFQTPFDFKTFMMSRAIFNGVAYAYKVYGINPRVAGGREVKALIPLNPDRVEFKLDSNFNPVFWWTKPDGTRIPVPPQDMFWFRAPYSHDGIRGSKLIEVAAEALGLAHTAERASGRVMVNGALVGGVLEHPKTLTEPAANRLRAQFEERFASVENAGRWVVAEEGLKAVPNANSTSLKDAQMAELRKFQAEEIGRFMDIPRPLLMLDETSWGTGIEQLGLFLITYCLLPWMVQWEEAVARSLLSEADQGKYFAKFNEAALLRGSLADQAAFFSKALGSGGGYGWMQPNEVRDKFNQPPVKGGDVLPKPTKKPGAGDGSGDGGDGTGDGTGDAPGGGAQPPAPPSKGFA